MTPAPVRHLDYVEALRFLREFTYSPGDCGIYSLLIRATAASPAAADVLVKAELQTRLQRRTAVIAAAAAMASELDAERASQRLGNHGGKRAQP